MPIINTIEGDLIQIFKAKGARKFDAIAHGANCFHTMGAGIAAGIAANFPGAVLVDQQHHTKGDISALGQFSFARTQWGIVINLYTQFTPGRVPPDGIVKNAGLSLGSVNTHIRRPSTKVGPRRLRLGIPMIGAGIAGGVWEDIAARIDLVTPDIDITLVKYVPNAI